MKLAEFAKWAIAEGPFDGRDLGGWDIQEKAVECGILIETKYDPARHGENHIDAEPGDRWYEFTEEFKSVMH